MRQFAPPRLKPSRLVPLLALAFALTAAGAVLAEPDSTWVEHSRAARACYARADMAGFRAHTRAVRDQLGETPSVAYNLACAAARLGERDEALRELATYAASGLTADIAADSDLVSLWRDTAFVAVEARIRANADSVGSAREVHRLSDPDLLTEDLAYDPATHALFLSSVHRGGLVEVGGAGGAERRWGNLGMPPGWGSFAVRVDSARNLLWVSVAATPTTDAFVAADSGRTALVAWDLGRHLPVRRLEVPRDGRPHLVGDLTVGPDGVVYATDSRSGAVYLVRPGSDSLVAWLPPGTFRSPQTPALSADRRTLYVPDYPRGIACVTVATREISWMTFPPGTALAGIDGLYVWGRDLIAVQNGVTPRRLERFRLDARGTRVVSASPIESGTRRLGEPTHATAAGPWLYFIANSGWDRVGDDLRLRPGRSAPLILRVRPDPAD